MSMSIHNGHLRSGRAPRRSYVPLFQRVAGINALLLIAAVAVTLVVTAPHRLSSFAVEEVAVLVAALALMALTNMYLLRRVIGPLQALTALARRVDLANPGERMPDVEPTSEAGELALTFNEMLDRIEAERRDATGRVLAGQEAERLRIAQELHDEVGQQLTAVCSSSPGCNRARQRSCETRCRRSSQSSDRDSEDVRRIAIELRPEALDDLGLESALAVLCERFGERTGQPVSHRVAPDLAPMSPEAELVVYRVAQEALTNILRHSRSTQAAMTLESRQRADDAHRARLGARPAG